MRGRIIVEFRAPATDEQCRNIITRHFSHTVISRSLANRLEYVVGVTPRFELSYVAKYFGLSAVRHARVFVDPDNV